MKLEVGSDRKRSWQGGRDCGGGKGTGYERQGKLYALPGSDAFISVVTSQGHTVSRNARPGDPAVKIARDGVRRVRYVDLEEIF